MEFALTSVTLLSLLMTVAMAVVTWRLVREERRRSAARLAALAAELGPRRAPVETPARLASAASVPVAPRVSPPVPARTAGRVQTPPRVEVTIREQPALLGGSGTKTGGIFGAPIESTSGFLSRFAGLGVAAVVLIAVVSAAIFAFPDRDRDDTAPPEERAPFELLALDHESQDGFLAISGAVRNPLDGADATRLAVIAMAFDGEGTMVASGRAPVSTEVLLPGSEARFEISLPAERVNRYRISFLINEATVPHVDRRAVGEPAQERTES